MSATPATRGVQRLGNLITIDYLDHCAALAQERDTLFLQTVILAEQRDALAERLAASEALAAALYERVAELEAARRPSPLLALWGAACLAWFNFWQLFEPEAA